MTASSEIPIDDSTDALPPESHAEPHAELEALRAQVDDLRAQGEELRAQAQAAKDAQLRALAELDNVRKRAERDIAQSTKFGAEKLLGSLLGISDSIELGLTAAAKPEAQATTIAEGLELTRRQLVAILEKQGVTAVDPKGQPFNPDFHEAVSMVPSNEVAPNHILSVMQKGYKLHDRLLRPAMVIVARTP